jgi:hypothetical protein
MRLALVPLLLLTAAPAFTQGVESHWYLDVHRFTPTLEGHYQGTSDGQPFLVDLNNDLALAKDNTRIGYGLEYQGTRFGLELSRDEQDYAGSNRVQRNITINGQTFTANTLVTSSFKATNNTFNWTIRYLTWPQFWLGLDLGARATQTEINAFGVQGFTGVTASVNYKTTLPVPQIGPSLGFTAFHGRLVGRGLYHLLLYKDCTYNHLGVDLRYFPLSWLGVRAFADSERFRIPQGSIKSDMDITLDRSGTGFGIVARF